MAFTTKDSIRQVLSSTGATNWAEDDDGYFDEDTILDQAITWGEQKVKLFLNRRYTNAILEGNAWIAEATAIIAAHELCRRRGNPVPESLTLWYGEYMGYLEEIKNNHLDVPGAAERVNRAPMMSNMTVDLRYPGSTKLRVQNVSSTGPVNSEVNPRHPFSDPIEDVI